VTNISNEILLTLRKKGITPLKIVDASKFDIKYEAKSIAHFQELVGNLQNTIADLRERAKRFEEIVCFTLSARTAFKMKGGGRPQIGSNNANKISTGGFAANAAWEAKTDWPEFIRSREFDQLPLKNVFKKLYNENEEGEVFRFICSLVEYVINKSSPPQSNDEATC